MTYSQNPILSSLCLCVYKRASGSLTQVVDEAVHNCLPYAYKFRVIFNRTISYQSKQHLLFMPNNLRSSSADKEVNLLFKLLNNEFLHFVLLESCIISMSFTYLRTVLFFFFSTLSKNNQPPEETSLSCTIWYLPYPIPYFPAIFFPTSAYFLMMFSWGNIFLTM